MTTQRAAGSCGQLHIMIEGEPSRISMCRCLECQRRTGAVISNPWRRVRVKLSRGTHSSARQTYLKKRTRRAGDRRFRVAHKREVVVPPRRACFFWT